MEAVSPGCVETGPRRVETLRLVSASRRSVFAREAKVAEVALVCRWRSVGCGPTVSIERLP